MVKVIDTAKAMPVWFDSEPADRVGGQACGLGQADL